MAEILNGSRTEDIPIGWTTDIPEAGNWTLAITNRPAESGDPVTLVDEVYFYGLAVVITVGTICNLMNLVVLLGTAMRNTTSGHYLAALSVSDTLVLMAEFVKWISDQRFGIRPLHVTDWLCKVVYHVRYSSKLWSALLVTTVSFERYLIVAYPLKVNRFATKRVARWLIAVELVASAGLGSYGSVFFRLIRMAPTRTICLISFATAGAFSACDLIISKVIGQVITNVTVAVLTAIIIVSLTRSRRQRDIMASSGSSAVTSSATAERHLTVMLVVMATSFVVLRTPYTVTWYVSHFGSAGSRLSSSDKLLEGALQLTYLVATVNYAINFFLYSIAGKKFRMHLVQMCSCVRRRGTNQRQMASVVEKSTSLSTVSKIVSSRM